MLIIQSHGKNLEQSTVHNDLYTYSYIVLKGICMIIIMHAVVDYNKM